MKHYGTNQPRALPPCKEQISEAGDCLSMKTRVGKCCTAVARVVPSSVPQYVFALFLCFAFTFFIFISEFSRLSNYINLIKFFHVKWRNGLMWQSM